MCIILSFTCHSKMFWTISLIFCHQKCLSKMAQKTFTITFYSSGLSFQWWSDSILGACMTLNAPFQKKVITTSSSWSVHRKEHARMRGPTHTFLTGGNSSSQEFLGNFCSTSQANEISGDCGDRVAIVGIIQCASSSSLHCLGWKVLSWRLVHWPAGVLLSSPLPQTWWDAGRKGMINWLQVKGGLALMVIWRACLFDTCINCKLDEASRYFGQIWLSNKFVKSHFLMLITVYINTSVLSSFTNSEYQLISDSQSSKFTLLLS